MKNNGYLIIKNGKIVNWKAPITEAQAEEFEWDVCTTCRQVKTDNGSRDVSLYKYADGTLIHITYAEASSEITQIAIMLSGSRYGYTCVYRKTSNRIFMDWLGNINESIDELVAVTAYLNDDGLDRLDALRAVCELAEHCNYAYELVSLIDDTRIEQINDEYFNSWDKTNALYHSLSTFIKDEIAQLRQIAIVER